jgi:zinc D-Ala-D-Ala carboxypeptidase
LPRYGFWALTALLALVTAGLVLWRSDEPPRPTADRTPAVLGATSPSPEPSATPTPPPCSYGDLPAQKAGYKQWDETLLDPRYRLPNDYEPPALVSTAKAGFQEGFLIRSLVIPDLAALRRAAEDAGFPLALVAAYRSYSDQASLFERREDNLGFEAALRKTARPGHSEHQLATTVDLKSLGARGVTQAWGSTPAGRWVQANAHRFGFIQSYPRRRQEVTCYGYEPWHYRYLGRGLAMKVHASGLTLREYLWIQQREDEAT